MKHKLSIITAICLIFLLSQLFGIYTIAHITKIVNQNNKPKIESKEIPLTPRPQLRNLSLVISLIVGILIVTTLILLLRKLKKPFIWRAWYLSAIFFCVAVTLSAFTNKTVALLIAGGAVAVKLINKLSFLSNIIEILVYTGLALIFGPLLSLRWATVLLILIAIYDYLAVFKIKHMISLAEFQKESGAFSGVKIDYIPDEIKEKGEKDEGEKIKEKAKEEGKEKKKENANSFGALKPALKQKEGFYISNKTPFPASQKVKSAILGGGDIAFPLIFNTSFFQWSLPFTLSKIQSFIATSWIALFQTISLLLLFLLAKKEKYYPAMPILTLGSLIGVMSSIKLFIPIS